MTPENSSGYLQEKPVTSNTDGPGDAPKPQGFDFMLRPPGEAPAAAPAPADFGLGDRPRRELRKQAPVDSSTVGRTVVIIALIVAVLGVAGYATYSFVQSSEAQTKAETQPFCSALDETPGQLQQPAFGWPTEVADLTTSLAEIQTFADRWAQLASVAPEGIKPDATAVADGATAIIGAINTSKTIDRAGNLAAMEKITKATNIVGWTNKYCD
jgi:Tfp pilus assembly protein PilV